jgi:hypothetical protein
MTLCRTLCGFSEAGNLYGLRRVGFSIRSRYSRRAKNKLKISRVESIVSHSLNSQRGGSLGWIDGRVRQPRNPPLDNSGVPLGSTLVTNSPSRTVRRRTYRRRPML